MGSVMGGQPTRALDCYAFVKSPSGNGLDCVLSDPMDKYMTEDELWEKLLRWRREPYTNAYDTSCEVTVEENGTIRCRKDFDKEKMPEWLKKQGATPSRLYVTTVDKEKRTINRATYLNDERTLVGSRDVIIIHSDPIIVEVCRINVMGVRNAGPQVRDFFAERLNQLLEGEQVPMPDFEEVDSPEVMNRVASSWF
eukprot:TRINITY_DN23571_c0_g2_i1.p1 TRINITY_DN23571_c0_g2~~TRINITY_DN23571_c0_g2_i1.p1  ORF type:complete len:215 (+),score=19.96 TRINITY_DN23571_c0_g2_i1:59-646(+)